jgi:hypothetical protein
LQLEVALCLKVCYIIKTITTQLTHEGNMQNTFYVLQLQGTGDDEYAFENAGVFTTQQKATEKLAYINAEYDVLVFTLNENARIFWLHCIKKCAITI